jgi:hypothetical protein
MSPSELVTTVAVLVPRVSLTRTTFAEVMTPPVESTTRPVTVPVVI